MTKRSLPNVSITVAGTSDGTYWGGQPCVRNTASKVLGETHEDREQESRTGRSGAWGRAGLGKDASQFRADPLEPLAGGLGPARL